jgi:rare lipoprotein A
MTQIHSHTLATAALALLAFAVWRPLDAAAAPAGERAQTRAGERAAPPRKLDHSGRAQVGKASVYARKFARRKMADGTPMDLRGGNAASKTLPLGTVAKVTNLETGRSATVTIQDRGPHAPGRIVDVSPGTAQELGLSHKQGLALVEVAPIAVPQPGGQLRPGAGSK